VTMPHIILPRRKPINCLLPITAIFNSRLVTSMYEPLSIDYLAIKDILTARHLVIEKLNDLVTLMVGCALS